MASHVTVVLHYPNMLTEEEDALTTTVRNFRRAQPQGTTAELKFVRDTNDRSQDANT